MYKIIILFAALFFVGCDDRFIRAEIYNDDIKIEWFYESYLTDDSPDFITVTKGSEEKEIYKAVDVVTNVSVQGKDIVIKLYKPERGIVFTKAASQNVFGYKVILDSSANYEEYRSVPDGKNQ